MATTYSIETADLAQAGPEVQDLWVRNLVGYDASSAAIKLRLGYLDNPAGLGVVLLLKAEGLAAAQGAQGLHPRRFHLGNSSLNAIGLADYVVSPEHRSLGPALMLARRSAQLGVERFDLTYGLPNAKAAPVFARAGLKHIGALRHYAKLLSSRHFLTSRMPHGLARCCAPFVDAALSLADRLRRRRTGAPLACRPAAWDDPAFDELWAQRPAGTLLSERTGRMLRWRFGTPGRDAWRACVACDADGQAQGYLVWRQTGAVARVGDFFTRDPGTMTAPLMLAFSEVARAAGMRSVSVEFFGSSTVRDQLLGAGLVARPEKMALFIGASVPGGLESPEVWYLTTFDNDAD